MGSLSRKSRLYRGVLTSYNPVDLLGETGFDQSRNHWRWVWRLGLRQTLAKDHNENFSVDVNRRQEPSPLSALTIPSCNGRSQSG